MVVIVAVGCMGIAYRVPFTRVPYPATLWVEPISFQWKRNLNSSDESSLLYAGARSSERERPQRLKELDIMSPFDLLWVHAPTLFHANFLHLSDSWLGSALGTNQFEAEPQRYIITGRYQSHCGATWWEYRRSD